MCAGTSLLLVVASRRGLAALGENLLCWPDLDLHQTDRKGRDAVGLAIMNKNIRFGTALLCRWVTWIAGECAHATWCATCAAAMELYYTVLYCALHGSKSYSRGSLISTCCVADRKQLPILLTSGYSRKASMLLLVL